MTEGVSGKTSSLLWLLFIMNPDETASTEWRQNILQTGQCRLQE